jgi:hypothetical protein
VLLDHINILFEIIDCLVYFFKVRCQIALSSWFLDFSFSIQIADLSAVACDNHPGS